MSPETLIMDIANGKWKDYITYLRNLGKNEYKAEKKSLPAATWSGVFKEGTRLIDTIEKYSQLVVLDIDNLDPSSIGALKSQIFNDPYVKYCFTSPSGNGIKIVVQVNTGPDNHRAAFLHLQKVFEEKYLIKVDPSGKDVCRLCYISWDPETIIKSNCQVFEVDTKYREIISAVLPTTPEGYKHQEDTKTMFAVAVKWVERNKTYTEGSRNVYIHALACALNRLGMDIDQTINVISQNYQTPDIKWHQSVRSAYFHNQGEHGSVQMRNTGAVDFIAPPYVANFTDDVAADDLMRTTAMLWSHKVPPPYIMDLVGKVAKYYDRMGYIDMRRTDLAGLMNNAVAVLNSNIASNAAQLSLKYQEAESMIDDLVGIDMSNVMKTYIPPFDEIIGGLMPGNFYGLIGFGETFKSVLAQYWAYMNAINDVPVLYLNSEMAKIQYYERLVLQAMGINFRSALMHGHVNKDNSEDFKAQVQAKTKNNIFVFSGIDFDKPKILATIDHIYATTGKKVKFVIMDGLSQMNQAGKEEAPANIHNSGICKELSKEAHGGEGVVLIALIHCSGSENKLIRNTGTIVRGGSKLLANMDGYFSTSLFVDPMNINVENPQDVNFLEGKFCLRFADKRGGTGVHYTVLNVEKNLMLTHENVDYRQYEVKQN